MSLTRRAMRDAQIRYSRRFRRLPFRPARASQPSGLRLLHASNVTAPVQLLMFGPSPPCLAATMASADFYPPIATPHGVGQPRWQTGRPPRVRRLTFAPYTRRIYAGSVPDGIGLRVFWPARPPTGASYAIRVPQAGALPTASFRPRLATTPLLFG